MENDGADRGLFVSRSYRVKVSGAIVTMLHFLLGAHIDINFRRRAFSSFVLRPNLSYIRKVIIQAPN